MKATVAGRVIAASDDVVEHGGYAYFPPGSVRTEWLERAPKTASDRACPHDVQFYDVVLDGQRFARAAWSYKAPRPALHKLADRFGFWEDVEVG